MRTRDQCFLKTMNWNPVDDKIDREDKNYLKPEN